MSDTATLHLLIILGRTFQFASGMLLVNVAVFRWLILGPAWTGLGATTRPLRLLRRGFALTCAGCAGALVLSGALLFLGAAADMSGVPLAGAFDGGLLATVLWQTDFGRVCQVRAVLAVMLGFTLWRTDRASSRQARVNGGWEAVTVLLAGALFLAVAWTGHAAASVPHHDGLSWPLLADAAHLASASIWPGGLLPFAFFLGSMEKAGPAYLPLTLQSVRRFSAVSLGGVSLLALTGALNSFFLVKTLANLGTTPYGHVLVLKLLLFTLMLAVAAWNRQVLLPRLFARGDSRDAGGATAILRSLRLFVLAEACLAAVVLIVVAVLGVTPPPDFPP